MTGGKMALLEVEALRVSYPDGRGGRRLALDQVSLEVCEGQAVGLVGESGSGKSTLARAVMRLLPVDAGRIRFQGTDLLALSGRRLRSLRRHFQMVFQDPRGSLDPRWPVGRSVAEPLVAFEPHLGASEREARVATLLELVGLDSSLSQRFPAELSGGQLQRVAIARALASNPKLLVADEPTSALDVSVQAQVVNLLGRLQRERGLAMLFISHDISLVRLICERVAVLLSGRVVELGPTSQVTTEPLHPYARALLEAVPTTSERRIRPGAVSDLQAPPPAGCPFEPWCPVGRGKERCRRDRPELRTVTSTRQVACHEVASGPPEGLARRPRFGQAQDGTESGD